MDGGGVGGGQGPGHLLAHRAAADQAGDLAPHGVPHPLGRLAGRGGQRHVQGAALGLRQPVGDGQESGHGVGLAGAGAPGDDRHPRGHGPADGSPLQVGRTGPGRIEQVVEGGLEGGRPCRGVPR